MSQLIISQSYLIEKSVITSNTDFKYITPVIDWVQKLKLRPLLGTDLYNQIMTQSTPTTSLSAANLIIMNDYILDYLTYYIMSECVMTLRYKYTNIGVVVRGTADLQAITKEEAADLRDFYKNKAEEFGQLMINYIKNNQNLYPAYFTNSGADIVPNKDSYEVDIYLPNGIKYLANDAGELHD
jgi:hypothetical protein